uniref:Product n=1 Tax=Schistosoma curassoni TaxID=6186 RepID=A0A183JZN5_9TREM
LLFILFISANNYPRCVFYNLTPSRFPSELQVSARFVIQSDDLHNVCPIHFQPHFLISSSTQSWFILSHSKLLLLVSSQRTLSILRRQLFINTFIFLMMVVVVLQVSTPYSITILKFVLKIVTLILVDSCFEFHVFFNCRNAAQV